MESDTLDTESDNNDSQDANSTPNESAANVSIANVADTSVRTTLTLLDGKFFKYESTSSNGKSVLVTCMKCEPKVVKIKGSPNSTSNFLSHLKRKHGDEAVTEYHAYAKQNKQIRQNIRSNETESQGPVTATSSSSYIRSQTSQTSFENDLALFFISSMIPLNAVEDPYFVALVKKNCLNGLNPISRRTLSRRIDAEHTQQTAKIKQKLNDVQYICTVVDIWSSRKRSFLGVTAHWIDEELKRQSNTLACRRFPGIHNYERIAMILDEIHSEFNLDLTKIIATVTDNGSNFVKAFKEFGVSIANLESINVEEEDNVLEGLDNKEDTSIESQDFTLACHFRCASHTLNLCSTTDANRVLKGNNNTPLSIIHQSTIGKCNLLWNAAGRPKSAEIIQNTLGHTLSKPGVTRWNSLYDAMKQIYGVKDKNIQLHRALGLINCISDREYNYINEYITCSRPIAEALDILQGETDMFYGLLIPCLMALRKKLRKIERTSLTYCHDLAVTYRQSVERRFNEFLELFTSKAQYAIIATLSYPRFKNKWFTCIAAHDQSRIKTLFKHEIAKEVSKNTEDTELRAATDSENIFFDFESDSGSDIDLQLQEKQTPKTRAEVIMSQYFAEEDRTFNVLDRYPEIRTIFKRYNTPLPSSASVERVFSYATMINLPKASKLSDNMFEQRVVMKTNINKSI